MCGVVLCLWCECVYIRFVSSVGRAFGCYQPHLWLQSPKGHRFEPDMKRSILFSPSSESWFGCSYDEVTFVVWIPISLIKFPHKMMIENTYHRQVKISPRCFLDVSSDCFPRGSLSFRSYFQCLRAVLGHQVSRAKQNIRFLGKMTIRYRALINDSEKFIIHVRLVPYHRGKYVIPDYE